MANRNYICVFDFETGGKYPHISQPTSLSCLVIDPVRLEIIRDSKFDTFIRPVFDEKECEKLGLEPLQQEALDITGIKIEDLEKAPSLKEVWDRFTSHVSKYNTGSGKWAKPIACGYNIYNFDMIIINKLAKEFGCWDKERQCQDLFHPRDCIDIMQSISWFLFENDFNNRSISFDSIRKYFGFTTEGAHSSIVDVEQNAAFLIRWMKWQRNTYKKLKLKDSMKDINLNSFYDIQV